MRSAEQIALWDGRRTDGIAGTAASVRFMLEGVPEPIVSRRSDLDPEPIGPIIQIVTPREANPSPDGVPYSIKRLYPPFLISQVDNEDVFADLLHHLDNYNNDAIECAHVRKMRHFSLEELQNITEVLSGYYQGWTQRVLLSALAFCLGNRLFRPICYGVASIGIGVTELFRLNAWRRYRLCDFSTARLSRSLSRLSFTRRGLARGRFLASSWRRRIAR